MKKKHEFFKVFEIKWYPKPCLSGGKNWEPGEYIGNPLGNLKGTCWEQRKNDKKSFLSSPPNQPTQNLKEKKKNKAL